MQLSHLSWIVFAAFLAACAIPSSRISEEIRSAGAAAQAVAPGVTLLLPSGPPFPNTARVVQLVNARYGDRTQSFQTVIDIAPERFRLVATAPAGPRAATIDWTPGSIAVEREPLAPDEFEAERILVDLMLVYAADDVLREAVRGAEFVGSDGNIRRLLVDGKAVVQIVRPQPDPWEGRASLVNTAYDYELTIKSRRVLP